MAIGHGCFVMAVVTGDGPWFAKPSDLTFGFFAKDFFFFFWVL
jgi:hypothetical protein